jgi:hypothetical protein
MRCQIKGRSEDASFGLGMGFDVDLVLYCGGTCRFKVRVERFANEKTDKMSKMMTPAVMLEGI